MSEMWITVPGIAYKENKGYRLVIPSMGIEIMADTHNNIQKYLQTAAIKALGEEIAMPEVSWHQPSLKTQSSPNAEHFTASFREWDRIINFVLDREPLVETKERAKKAKIPSHLTDVSPQPIVDYGYPYDWLNGGK